MKRNLCFRITAKLGIHGNKENKAGHTVRKSPQKKKREELEKNRKKEKKK